SRADCESVSPDEHDSQKLVKVLGVKRLLPVSGAPLERTAAIAALTTGPSRAAVPLGRLSAQSVGRTSPRHPAAASRAETAPPRLPTRARWPRAVLRDRRRRGRRTTAAQRDPLAPAADRVLAPDAPGQRRRRRAWRSRARIHASASSPPRGQA